MTRHVAQPTINKDEEKMRELREDGSTKSLKEAQAIAAKDPAALDQLIADEAEATEIGGLDDVERGEPGDDADLNALGDAVLGEDDEGPEPL